MKTTTRSTRIGNFGKVGRCFHTVKDNSFNLIENFGAVALDIFQKRFANEKKILSLQSLK
jgi:hypothetical protein